MAPSSQSVLAADDAQPAAHPQPPGPEALLRSPLQLSDSAAVPLQQKDSSPDPFKLVRAATYHDDDDCGRVQARLQSPATVVPAELVVDSETERAIGNPIRLALESDLCPAQTASNPATAKTPERAPSPEAQPDRPAVCSPCGRGGYRKRGSPGTDGSSPLGVGYASIVSVSGRAVSSISSPPPSLIDDGVSSHGDSDDYRPVGLESNRVVPGSGVSDGGCSDDGCSRGGSSDSGSSGGGSSDGGSSDRGKSGCNVDYRSDEGDDESGQGQPAANRRHADDQKDDVSYVPSSGAASPVSSEWSGQSDLDTEDDGRDLS